MARNLLISSHGSERGWFIMVTKEYIYEPSRRRGRKRKLSTPLNLERIYKKNGSYDGKVFYSADKVTYTFLYEDDVIVLHFDMNRNNLYLKGHKITSLDMRENLEEFLTMFKKSLQDNPKTEKFVKPFDTVVSKLV